MREPILRTKTMTMRMGRWFTNYSINPRANFQVYPQCISSLSFSVSYHGKLSPINNWRGWGSLSCAAKQWRWGWAADLQIIQSTPEKIFKSTHDAFQFHFSNWVLIASSSPINNWQGRGSLSCAPKQWWWGRTADLQIIQSTPDSQIYPQSISSISVFYEYMFTRLSF